MITAHPASEWGLCALELCSNLNAATASLGTIAAGERGADGWCFSRSSRKEDQGRMKALPLFPNELSMLSSLQLVEWGNRISPLRH